MAPLGASSTGLVRRPALLRQRGDESRQWRGRHNSRCRVRPSPIAAATTAVPSRRLRGRRAATRVMVRISSPISSHAGAAEPGRDGYPHEYVVASAAAFDMNQGGGIETEFHRPVHPAPGRRTYVRPARLRPQAPAGRQPRPATCGASAGLAADRTQIRHRGVAMLSPLVGHGASACRWRIFHERIARRGRNHRAWPLTCYRAYLCLRREAAARPARPSPPKLRRADSPHGLFGEWLA